MGKRQAARGLLPGPSASTGRPGNQAHILGGIDDCRQNRILEGLAPGNGPAHRSAYRPFADRALRPTPSRRDSYRGRRELR
jgi:hypothetical protein